ncbi:glycosyltransferase [Psychroserpens sp. Hel_I_66]|uniref:glycosyltransferase n=1 Tax=Psychroserpens sp. Hel_I_66 TaxID=1250004 RepID=UPI000647C6D5|nr:glycosyltransferase [Psychroserpens sp. Hel_I_66]
MEFKSIAVIVQYFPTISETFIVNQINSLINAGYNVKLYSYNKVELKFVHNAINRYNLINAVTYFEKPPVSKIRRLGSFFKWTFMHFKHVKWKLYFKTLNIFKYGKDAFTLKLFFESQWFLVENDIDLIHAHFGMVGNRIAYLKTQQVILGSVKLITTFHGYDLIPSKLLDYKAGYRHLFAKANVFTVNTPYLKSILQQINSNNIPCYILPVGLDTDFFKREATKQNHTNFNLVFCGKLIPLKGPDLAISIVKKLQDLGYRDVRLHILGDGALRKDLECQIEDSNLQEVVYIHGKQTQVQIRAFFEKSDLFLLPGLYEKKTGRAETQGLVIQEAQAMELPVVVSDAGGMKYGLLPNESGFVIKENDINAFVEVIERLILDPKLCKDMGSIGRQFVKKNYDNQVLLKKMLEIYQSL